MVFKIEITSYFQKNIKDLSKKKYRKIIDDLKELNQTLSENPQAGDPLEEFNDLIWKVRMGSSDMQKGKRGGFRVIYFFHPELNTVYLLTIYPKNEIENLAKKEIEAILKKTDLWDRFFIPKDGESSTKKKEL